MNTTKHLIIILLFALSTSLALAQNPPAAGFNASGSDAKAIEIADSVMAAMGGRQAWDATRFLRWNFFGSRFHFWDKHTGDIRVHNLREGDNQGLIVLMNIHNQQGRAFDKDGNEITDNEALAKHLKWGYEVWINDSYWLVMPYKLKDSGVTLKYLGQENMEDERPADVLQMTFQDVGVTPENKYHVYVAKDTGLVEQWAFYPKAELDEPQFKTPWHGWQDYGQIKLCGDRGKYQLSEIAVYEKLPEALFKDPKAALP